MKSEKRLKLSAAAFASVGLYLLLALRYPLGPSLADPRASWASMVEATWLSAVFHLLIYLGLILLYLFVLHLLTPSNVERETQRRERSNVVDLIASIAGGYPDGHTLIPWLGRGSPVRGLSPRSGLRKTSRGLESPAITEQDSTESKGSPRRPIHLVLITWLACSGVLMFLAPAGESHDIFDYLFRGRMMTEYQANPLVDVPEDFSLSTPYSRYLAWRKYVDTYGPVWEASSAAVSSAVHQVADWLGWYQDTPVCPHSPESCRLLIVYLTGYRLLAIGLTGLSGWLIFNMVGRSQASLAPLALAAWLLNPITLMASAVGGHNDALMLVLVLSGWWLLQRQRPFWGILAIILAAHVKLTALIWLPACALWILWRWGWARALKIGLANLASGLALSWLLYAPFGGWGTLSRMLYERSEFFANSIWRVLNYLLHYRWGWSTESAHQLSTNLPNLLFVAGALIVPLWTFNFRPQRWRSASIVATVEADQKLWRALTAVSMLYLLVGSFWFQHWYVLWALAPAVLSPDSRFTRSMLPWLAFGALSSNAAMSFLLATALENAPRILSYTTVVAIIWGPLLVALSLDAFGKQRRKRRFALRFQEPYG